MWVTVGWARKAYLLTGYNGDPLHLGKHIALAVWVANRSGLQPAGLVRFTSLRVTWVVSQGICGHCCLVSVRHGLKGSGMLPTPFVSCETGLVPGQYGIGCWLSSHIPTAHLIHTPWGVRGLGVAAVAAVAAAAAATVRLCGWW